MNYKPILSIISIIYHFSVLHTDYTGISKYRYRLYRYLKSYISTVMSIFIYYDADYIGIFSTIYRLDRYFQPKVSIISVFQDKYIDDTDNSGPTYRLYRYFRTNISITPIFLDKNIDYIKIETHLLQKGVLRISFPGWGVTVL